MPRSVRGFLGGLAVGTLLVGVGVVRSLVAQRTPNFLWQQPRILILYVLAFGLAGWLIGTLVKPTTNRVDTLTVWGLAGALCLTAVGLIARTPTSGRTFHFVFMPAVGGVAGVLMGRSVLSGRGSESARLHANDR
ncbi:MAG TPA: hypothetical protein VIP11_04580 [Gemmatimonadaceae bacterium]